MDGDGRKRSFPGSSLMRRPKVRRWLVISAAVLILYTLVGFFAVPPLLRSVLTSKLTEALHRTTSIEKVSVNPFVLSVDVRGLKVDERGSRARFFSLGELYADFKLSSLYRLAPVVSELRLVDPYVHVVRRTNDSYNFSDLLTPAAPTKKKPAKPPHYALNNIQLSGGDVVFDDLPKDKVHRVTGLYLAIPFISDLPNDTEIFVKPALRAVVNGTRVDLEGESKPFSKSQRTSLDFEFQKLNLPTYLAYLPMKLGVKVPSALLSGHVTLAFRHEKNQPPELVLTGRAALSDVRVTDESGAELLEVPLLGAEIAESNLLTGRIRLASVLVRQPRLWLKRDADGAFNLTALVPDSGGDGAAASATTGGGVFEIKELQVKNGSAAFSDATVSPTFEAAMRSVELDVRGFSTANGKKATTRLSLATGASATLEESGEMTWSPLELRGTLKVANAPVPQYRSYYQPALGFEIANGVLDASTGFTWDGSVDGWRLSGLEGTLRSLQLKQAGAKRDLVTVPQMTLADSAVDIHGQSVVLGSVGLDGARMLVRRDKAGAWNLAAFAPPAAPAAAPAAADGPGWSFTAKKLAMERTTVEVDDAFPAQPVHLVLAPLTMRMTDLSTTPGTHGRVELQSSVDRTGRVALVGELGINPLAAKLEAKIQDVPLVPLQGYVTDRLRLAVNDGEASAAGTLTFDTGGATPRAGFTGQASVDHLATVDAIAAHDLVRWKSLAVYGLSFASSPLHLAIKQVSLAGLVTDLIVEPDGALNLKQVLGMPLAAAAAPAAEGGKPSPAGPSNEAIPQVVVGPEAAAVPTAVPPPSAAQPTGAQGAETGAGSAIQIDEVTVSGGSIVLVDHSVKPEVRIEAAKLGGSVSGLSSLASTAADVDLHTVLNGEAPLSLKGKINPLAGSLFFDVKLELHDFDLPTLSPYSGIYAGYTVDRGKLDMNLDYELSRLHLKADNVVELDQLDLGSETDSPKAIHAPLRLAVSLLKNRDGVINLNLPVSGTLGDPKFKLGKIIVRMILHLLEKVATSPFSLLGKLVGGGHAHLDTVAFAPGSATLDAQASQELDTVAKALYERPGLRLDITGRDDPKVDAEGLRQLALERAVKREKLNQIIKNGGTAPSLDAVVVPPAEYDKYLTLAYKHGKFKKPRTWIGLLKKEPVPEMKKLLLASFTPGADALRNLASARAEAVQSALLKTDKVKPDQLFIVGLEGATKKVRDKGPGARVDLSLK